MTDELSGFISTLPTVVNIFKEGPWYRRWNVIVSDEFTVYHDSRHTFKRSAKKAAERGIETALQYKSF